MIKVGLVQINNEFSGQCYLPYSVGFLQAYAQKYSSNPDNFKFLMPVYSRIKVNNAVRELIEADVVAFSIYVWNFEISIAIASELKKQKPETIVVFGGPHVPDGLKKFGRQNKNTDLVSMTPLPKRAGMTQQFHRQYPFIDVACHGEGEQVFLSILERIQSDKGNWSDIPSVSFIRPDGQFIQNSRINRIKNLSTVPSPYLSGVFGELMEAHKNQEWIAVWETDRGCVYQCEYCDWGGAVEDQLNQFGMDSIEKDIEWFAEKKIPYVFCANANFGILKRDVEIAEHIAKIHALTGFPNAVSTQNAKNPKEHTIRALKILEAAGVNKAAVMSLQSVNPATLKAVRRDNMKLDEYYAIQKELALGGVYTMTDFILGMPAETYDTLAGGVETIIERGQHNRIQFNNLSILPNTGMGNPEYQEEYGLKIVRSKIINVHGTKENSEDNVQEFQDLCVASKSMPEEDWVRARAFCYMVGLLHFNKMLPIPIIMLRTVYGLGYREILEIFSESHDFINSQSFPIIFEIREFFRQVAHNIQSGGEEFIHSQEWLNIYWPPEEYIFIKLCVENKLDSFYREASEAMKFYLSRKNINYSDDIISEAVRLNGGLIKIPFQTKNLEIKLSHNVWDVYQSTIAGLPCKLEKKECSYVIDRTTDVWTSWPDWFQRMVWYQNRRGAYWYGRKTTEKDVAGLGYH